MIQAVFSLIPIQSDLIVANNSKQKKIRQAKIKWWGWLIIIFNFIALFAAYKMEYLYDNWHKIKW